MPYMVTFTINIPQMLAYIHTIHGSYGIWKIHGNSYNLQGSFLGGSLNAANVAGRRPSL